jgi:hypothetical protein
MKSIEINGQTYPIRVGLRAIELFELRTKIILAEFKGSVHQIIVMAHEGVKAGQSDLKEKEISFDDFRNALDRDPKSFATVSRIVMEEVMALLSEMQGIEEALPEEEKKSEESQ